MTDNPYQAIVDEAIDGMAKRLENHQQDDHVHEITKVLPDIMAGGFARYCSTCFKFVRVEPSDLPLPGEVYKDERNWGETIIASIWLDDDALTAMLLTLSKDAPFYKVRDIQFDGTKWVTTNTREHPNIVPAVEDYVQNGGDY